MMLFLLVFAMTFSATALLTPAVRRLAWRWGAVDRPGFRRVHTKPTPRMGGLAIFIAITLALCIARGGSEATVGIITGSVVIVLLGIYDDIRGVPAKIKLAFQVLAACIPVAYGFYFSWVVNPFGGAFYVDGLGAVFAILWIVGMINTINLSDGLDGLAAGITMIAATTFFFLALSYGHFGVAILSVALVGSTLGFLQYNFNPAVIFMGDTGSMYLGYMLGVLVLESMAQRASMTEFLIPLMILGLPILDLLFAIVRRKMNGQPIMTADRAHIHHRILDKGYTPKQTVLLLYGLSAGLGMLALSVIYLRWASIVMALAFGLMTILVWRMYPRPQWLKRRYQLGKRG